MGVSFLNLGTNLNIGNNIDNKITGYSTKINLGGSSTGIGSMFTDWSNGKLDANISKYLLFFLIYYFIRS